MKRVVVLALLLTAAVACGLPSDSQPRQIADDKVPFELLGPSTTSPASTVPGGPNVRLFFLDGTQVHALNRSVTNRDPQSVLNELVKGLTDTDPAGITTAIPKDTQIVRVVADGTTLVVTLNSAILNIAGTEQKNAFGQLVYTVTDLDFSGVRFRVTDASGAEQDVPTPTDNGAKAGSVGRSDFLSLQKPG
jgi:hypothetical protein